MINRLVEQIKKARLIFICGNGGSASTAEHFTNDLIKKGYPAICLNSNVSVITMIANDYGYDYIFTKQLSVLGKREDLLITISCSGNSQNVINVKYNAKLNKKMSIYEFETFESGQWGSRIDYGLLEDKHLKFAHEVIKKL